MNQLQDALEAELQIGCTLNLHVFQCESLKESYKVSKHLIVAVQNAQIIYAMELFLYHQKSLTTIYVSKVDTTGCHDRSQKSPASGITLVCLAMLMQQHKSPLRISLFARSQPQYIFPCSSQNAGKHVLDDRALIRWWISLLHRLLGHCTAMIEPRGYLLLPGCEKPETARFLPRESVWSVGYPGDKNALAKDAILKFPDDPKARFLDQLTLDKEIGHTTVDQFWEQMAYRQEMSSGHTVGFLTVDCRSSGSCQPEFHSIDEKAYQAILNGLQQETYSDEAETKAATAKWLKLSAAVTKSTTAIHVSGKMSIESKTETAHADLVVNEIQPRKKVKLGEEAQINVLIPRKKKEKTSIKTSVKKGESES